MVERPEVTLATAAASTPDWHAAYRQVAASFAAETLTTSYLVGLLREAQTPCQRCGSRTGTAVLVMGDERAFVCDICVARTPAFTERLATRLREDKPLLDRLADDRPIRVKDTSKFPPREKPWSGHEHWCPDHGYGCEPQNCPCGHSLRCDCVGIANEH